MRLRSRPPGGPCARRRRPRPPGAGRQQQLRQLTLKLTLKARWRPLRRSREPSRSVERRRCRSSSTMLSSSSSSSSWPEEAPPQRRTPAEGSAAPPPRRRTLCPPLLLLPRGDTTSGQGARSPSPRDSAAAAEPAAQTPGPVPVRHRFPLTTIREDECRLRKTERQIALAASSPSPLRTASQTPATAGLRWRQFHGGRDDVKHEVSCGGS